MKWIQTSNQTKVKLRKWSQLLIEHGYSNMALTYLENALSAYPSDELLRKLLKKLAKGKKIEA